VTKIAHAHRPRNVDFRLLALFSGKHARDCTARLQKAATDRPQASEGGQSGAGGNTDRQRAAARQSMISNLSVRECQPVLHHWQPAISCAISVGQLARCPHKGADFTRGASRGAAGGTLRHALRQAQRRPACYSIDGARKREAHARFSRPGREQGAERVLLDPSRSKTVSPAGKKPTFGCGPPEAALQDFATKPSRRASMAGIRSPATAASKTNGYLGPAGAGAR
jgi:hypothetical protein